MLNGVTTLSQPQQQHLQTYPKVEVRVHLYVRGLRWHYLHDFIFGYDDEN